MKSIGDYVFEFYDKYLKVSTKESELKSSNMWSSELQKGSDDTRLSPSKRRELANQSPIFMKGVRKKSMDSIRAWFDIEADNKSTPIQADINALRSFEKRCNYKKLFAQAIKDAHIYGDGFILLGFSNDKGMSLQMQPASNAEPITAMVISPEKITEVKYMSDKNKNMDLYHFVYRDGMKEKFIHPDRIQHIIVEEDSTSKLGLSKVDLLRNTIKSKKNVDIAVGRILAWFSHGLLDIKAKDLTDSELKELTKVAAEHPTSWVHDEDDFEIDVINPDQLQPKDYMDFIVLNIASCLNMPVHVLTGIQVGKVTGAEIGFADYYKDILDMQELIYTPLIEDLYSRIIKARGRVWKYSLKWNTVYVDEIGEANIMEKRMAFVAQGVQAGLIDLEEGRRMLNEGLIELDINKQIKPPSRPEQPNSPFKAKKKEEKEDE
ncbi:MAG: hypothetical protein DRN81_03995 [Thermoproteota archaeon]|nr:MAG: hypothetical protein DRN81_03995 [Candidatus Korarchaeota archaeon]